MKANPQQMIIGVAIGYWLTKKKLIPGIGKYYDSYNIKPDGRVDDWWRGMTPAPGKYLGRGEQRSDIQFFDPNAAIKHFGLYGIEFGNWMNQQNRLDFHYATMMSLVDLAQVLGIPQYEIGLGNTLSIGLGARGRGGKAMAFYVPQPYELINLTKTKGKGTLAHEYGHAIDYYLGKQYHGSKIIPSGGSTTVRNLRPVKGKKDTPEGVFLEFFDALYWDDNLESNFSVRLKQLPRPEYWASRVEVWARTFEAYIRMKLNEKGIKNTWLVPKKMDPAYYPTPKELKKVEPYIRKIIRLAY